MNKKQYGLIAIVVIALLCAVGVIFLMSGSTEVEPNNDGEYSYNEVTPMEPKATQEVKVTEQATPTPESSVTEVATPTPEETIEATPTEEIKVTEKPEPTKVPEPTAVPEEVEYKFANKKLLSQHYEKHGVEMGFASEKEYEKAASKVVNNPDALHKLEAEDGDDIYYVEATNEFVVVSTYGYIRTYFNPSSGKKYYDRQ